MSALQRRLARAHRDQAGEGVISSAIAVLITAFLGAAMWLVFNNLVNSAAETTCEQISTIGSGDANCTQGSAR